MDLVLSGLQEPQDKQFISKDVGSTSTTIILFGKHFTELDEIRPKYIIVSNMNVEKQSKQNETRKSLSVNNIL